MDDINNTDEIYDAEGGHTKEEADAEYARLFYELHGEELDPSTGYSNAGHTETDCALRAGDRVILIAASDEGGQALVAQITGPADISGSAGYPVFERTHFRSTIGALIWRDFKSRDAAVPPDYARELLKGIIIATDGFSSPDTSALDREAALDLAGSAGIDIASYILELRK